MFQLRYIVLLPSNIISVQLIFHTHTQTGSNVMLSCLGEGYEWFSDGAKKLVMNTNFVIFLKNSAVCSFHLEE